MTPTTTLSRLFHNTSPPYIWLRGCLTNGQVFSWLDHHTEQYESWKGVVVMNEAPVAVQLFQTPRKPGEITLHPVFVSQLWPPSHNPDQSTIDALHSFFRVRIEEEPQHVTWATNMPRMRTIEPLFRGVRLLRQDPVECLFSFICSSNNNISRIQQMICKLKTRYGTHLVDDLFAFPTIHELATKATESDLRDAGFGYRAKYVVETAKTLLGKSGGYLHGLKTLPQDKVVEELMDLQGVGPKVAACVALMSLEQTSLVPIDVHVLRLAHREFGDDVDAQTGTRIRDFDTLTKPCMAAITTAFHSRFGEQAGFAQCVLFSAELAQFREFVPHDLLLGMDSFKKATLAQSTQSKSNGKVTKQVDDDDNNGRKKRIRS